MLKKRDNRDFWDKFSDVMDSMGDYISEKADSISEWADEKGYKGYTSSTSVVEQNGMRIVTKTVNGKSTTTINGEEMVPKRIADELESALETVVKSVGVDKVPEKASQAVSRAYKSYSRYKEKNNG